MAPPLRINPGLYWLGLQSAPAQKTYFGTPPVVKYGWTIKAGSRRNNADPYADGPSAVFGDSLLDDKQMSIYAAGSY